MPLHKTFRKVIKRLEEDGFIVTVEESRHYKVTYVKGDFKNTQVLSKTPSSQSAIVNGIAGFRRVLRKHGYTTLDNFTARLTTEYELEKILEAATERLRHNIDTGNYDGAEDNLEVISAVGSFTDRCFEKNPSVVSAHKQYLDSKARV
jgi:hypothetical protein